MKRFFSIKWKIFFAILLTMVLPIMVITYVSNMISTQSLLEQTKINDLQTISSLQSATDTVLDAAESLGDTIAHDPSVLEFLLEGDQISTQNPVLFDRLDFQELTKNYLNHSKIALSVSLLNASGRFIGETRFQEDPLNWYYNRTLLNTCVEQNGYWTPPYLAFEKGDEKQWLISYITPLYHEQVLSGFLALHISRDILDDILSPIQDRVYIINDSEAFGANDLGNQESYILANKEQPYTYSNFYHSSKINYSYLRNNNSIITTSNGDKVTVTTRKFPRMKWMYLIISPFDEIGQAVLAHLSQIFTICILCLLFAVVAAFVVSRIITHPIAALNRTITKITEGDLSIRQTKISNDEIGNLATGFNALLDRIQVLLDNISQQQKNKRRLQLQLIQAQVKPHFLYNVLEMICSFIRDNLKVEALSSIAHLASFYRTSLSDGSDIIPIEKERDLIEDYLTLQHLRYIEFMDFTLSINPALYDYRIPKLTLQPLVENAIYHGLKQKCEKGTLCVVGYLQNNRIYFEIYDDGVGMSAQKIQEIMTTMEEDHIHQDFGLASVMKRLNIHFNGNAKISIESKLGEYTNLILSFPAVPNPPPR